MAEMNHFLGLITGKVESLCSLDDGIKALEMALVLNTSRE
jgi:hypothetical protein